MGEPKASSRSNGHMPLWVKVQGIFVILLVLVVFSMTTGILNIGLLLSVVGHTVPAGGH